MLKMPLLSLSNQNYISDGQSEILSRSVAEQTVEITEMNFETEEIEDAAKNFNSPGPS